jgi:UDP-N-acetylglucosamine 2-epimerase (non-hydrolysing)
MNSSKVIVVAGARPNYMKIAPLMREFASRPEFQAVLVHTGQHYGEDMSDSFFRDLEMKLPDHNLQVGSSSHAVQTAEIMKRFEPLLQAEKPQCVIVVGDVNSTLACALVAKKMGTPLIHVEAGLRSFDRSMPEEINRLATDAIADLLLVTEETGLMNLVREGAQRDRVRFVGNLMIDSLRFHLRRAQGRDTRQRLGVPPGQPYGVVTLHRPSNVDDIRMLSSIVDALSVISEDLPLWFSVHPRTRERINMSGLVMPARIHMTGPLGYLDFLALMEGSAAVLTDSGGIQEETTALGILCLTLRENTERPITISQGTNVLAGTSKESILRAWREQQDRPKTGAIPELWDGCAAERCVDAIAAFLHPPRTAMPARQAA